EAELEPKVPLQAAAQTSKPTTKPTKAPPQPRPDIETIRAQNYAGYAPQPAQPVTIPWWRQLIDNASEFGEKAIKAARDFGSQVVRYGVPIVATTLVGATTYQWARNVTSPVAFAEARERSQAQVAQLLVTYPDFLEPRDVRQQSVEGHPYLQMSRAMDGLDTLTEVAANYIDAAWQQNPVVQQGAPLLRQTADQSCPRWNETVGRICGSGLHVAAGIVEQPADTALGVLNGFVIQPTEGIAKILAFGVENNAIALGGDIIEAGRQSGVNGVIDTVGDYFHRVSAMTADGDVQGGLMAAALLGLAFAAPAAAFVLVAGSTLDSLSAMGKQILGAPTWEKAMQIAGSRETRTLVVTVAILLALGTAKGVKDWVQWERARPSLTPNVVAAFEKLPIAERSPVLEAAVRLGLNDAQVMGYIESMRGLPPQAAEILQRLPVEERVGVFTSTAKFLSSAQATPYEYNMFELGPLGGELEGIAPNFRGGQYTEFVAPSNLLAFRGQAGTRFANWMAFDPPTGLGSQLKYGVRPLWYDPATGRITGISLHDAGVVVLIREGTTLYVGPVSYQGGAFGFVDALQIYIRDAATNPGVVRLGPWELGQ
ncbi:MAG TPA: hypothetical protein VJP78_15060, partial [Thermoleophilia bacterium]|nr:hypothetical protein [Thermoleophilia bacterium]